jgi:catechol 2,3-dioxygenase-like lactoylglutathione lyase family enzyme
MMGRNSLQLELFEFANAKPKDAAYPVSDRGYSHFGVVVDDVDATYERLRAADVRIHCPVISFMGGSMKAAYCRDPDGNVFEIMQPGQVQD